MSSPKIQGPKIQGLADLEAEMRAVARGEKPAPADAAVASFNSVAALARLLTPENRRLLAMIRVCKSQSVAELAARVGRAEPNLLRTLEKLTASSGWNAPAAARCRSRRSREL